MNEVKVEVEAGSRLVVSNVPEEKDTYFGFEHFLWHTHGEIILMTGKDTSMSLTPDEVLLGYFSVEVLIVTEMKGGKTTDKWFIHKNEGLDLRYIGPGETISVKSMAEQNGAGQPDNHPEKS